MNDEKLKDKFKADELTKITQLVDGTVKWIESH